MRKHSRDQTSRPIEAVVNAVGSAEEVRSIPMTRLDDQLVEPGTGERKVDEKAKFREEARAERLGRSAENAVYSEDLTSQVTPPAAAHDGAEAWLEAVEPRRSLDEQELERAHNAKAMALEVPHRALDPWHKRIAYLAKAGFVIGDCGMLANQLYRSGSPLYLALLVGLSLAVTVVMVGAQAGHEIAAAHQREIRGPRPKGWPISVCSLFQPEAGLAVERFWRQLAYVAGGAMFLSLLFLGMGSGDPAKLALGYAALGGTTVLGSLCAEAWATNDAADHAEVCSQAVQTSVQALEPFEQAEQASAAAGTTAVLADTSARHRAVATSAAVTAVADRLPDTPEVGGYVDGGQLPAPKAVPEPADLILSAAVSVPEKSAPREAVTPRARKRPTYKISVPATPATAAVGKSPEGPGDPGAPGSSASGDSSGVKTQAHVSDIPAVDGVAAKRSSLNGSGTGNNDG